MSHPVTEDAERYWFARHSKSIIFLVCVLAVGALVLQNSSRQTDRVALEPGSAVLTTPDGAKVTTPDGVVVTVITEPDTAPSTTTNSDVVEIGRAHV